MADEDTTRIVTRKNLPNSDDAVTTSKIGSEARAISASDEPQTRIFRPSSSNSENPAARFNKDPVVGWVVIIDGPGKGQSLQLGYGMNGLGRNSDERVPLDFGDEEISRSAHAMITYDGKNRKFYIQHGGGVNLTYVGDNPVLQVQELKGGEEISIGKTRLCFVPFCGSSFDWQ